jgi:hypothetical protein
VLRGRPAFCGRIHFGKTLADNPHRTTLTDAAFVLLRQPTGIFNMRRKQAEPIAVSTLPSQEPTVSLRALYEFSLPQRLSVAVFRDSPKAVDST